MSGIITVLIMSLLLGLGSFCIGMLPLFFTFSRTRLGYLSTLGTGLLLGASLGVIIPEGIETLVSSSSDSKLPASKIALSLLVGFTFMLLVEQFISGHSHSHEASSPHLNKPNRTSPTASDVEFDVAMDELEGFQGAVRLSDADFESTNESKILATRAKAFPLTLGLVIHSLADGLALGASALPRHTTEEGSPSQLSLVIFLALIIHKAPTALALTMSLLSTSLSRAECKKHITFFSMSTPFGALVSFGILRFLGEGAEGDWPGIALLISGGTFLYVATVLQPVSHHGHSNGDINEQLRVALIVLGMFTPFLIGATIGHGHEHGAAPDHSPNMTMT